MSAPNEPPVHETTNTAAAAFNAASTTQGLPAKPTFSMAADESLPQDLLQPLRNTESKLDQVAPVIATENGVSEPSAALVSDVAVNGTLSGTEVTQTTYETAQPSTTTTVTTLESEVASMQESAPQSSSFAAITSQDTSAPSTLPTDTQVSNAATMLDSNVPVIASDAPTFAERTPISDLRTLPPSQPVSSDTALRIKSEKEQQDLVADPDLAESLGKDTSAPIENSVGQAQFTSSTHSDAPHSELQAETADAMDIASDTASVLGASLASPPPAPQLPPAVPVTDVTTASLPPPPQPAPAILPAEEPRDLAPTPAPISSSALPEAQADHQMLDVPTPPAKVSRERDEDSDEVQPAAKRTKTDGDAVEQDFKMPEVPQSAKSPVAQTVGTVAAQLTAGGADDMVTPPRLAHMKKIVSNLKKSNTSTWFRSPVDYVALKIPNYPSVVKKPMDLGTIDLKLKNQSYSYVSEFVDDFNLIVSNALIFNGPAHIVTTTAQKMGASFNNQMANMPNAAIPEPVREEKKEHKPKEQPTRSAPPRRQSIPAAAPPAPIAPPIRTASTAGPGQTFALNPEGVPTIRRDSTAQGDRPKRAIKPPKNHDIGSARPRKKKYELELKFCRETLLELKKPKNWAANQHFMSPVDPIALQIPTYFQIVKKPMDLGTVQHKLEANEYEKASDFSADVRLIFSNCFKFNKPGDYVFQCGKNLEKIFEDQWEKLGPWIAEKQPTSEPQSAGEDDEDDEESEEEEAEDSEDDRQEKIAALQKQMEAMSKHMSELAAPKKKKKSTPPVAAAKKSTKSKGGKKEKQQHAQFPALASKDKKKASAKAKPEKERYVSYNEKQYISTGIGQLDERRMSEALRIIQSSMPNLAASEQTEVELDIDELPNAVLLRLLAFLKKYVAQAPPEPPSEPHFSPTTAPSKPKKNKPMTKHEQEKQIEELRGKLADYNGGGPISPDAGKSFTTSLRCTVTDVLQHLQLKETIAAVTMTILKKARRSRCQACDRSKRWINQWKAASDWSCYISSLSSARKELHSL